MATIGVAAKPEPSIYTKFAIAAAIFFAVFEIGYLIVAHPPFDRLGYLIGRDFVNTWMGARATLAGHPADYFDMHVYNHALQALFGPNIPQQNWSYPPHILLLIWPLGFLPYFPAYIAWTLTGFALYLWAAGEGDYAKERMFFIAAAPAVAIDVLTGQNGFFTAALMIAGLSQLEKRPMLSGILFGLLTIKPQLGLMLPLMLMMTRSWRAIFSAMLTAAAMIAATSLIFGADIWRQYFHLVVPAQNAVMTQGTGPFVWMMPTVFMNARLVDAPLWLSWTLQAFVSALSIAAVIWTYWRKRDPLLSRAVLLAVVFLSTPYAFNYDMLMLSAVLADLAARPDNDIIDTRLILAVWVLPLAAMLLGGLHIPASSLVLMAFGGRCLWRMRGASSIRPQRLLLQPGR